MRIAPIDIIDYYEDKGDLYYEFQRLGETPAEAATGLYGTHGHRFRSVKALCRTLGHWHDGARTPRSVLAIRALAAAGIFRATEEEDGDW